MIVWIYIWKTVMYAGQHQSIESLYFAMAAAFAMIVWPVRIFKK